MSHLFSNYARWPINIVKGEGNYLFDDQGKKYLDLVSGIAVTSLGNIPPQVKAKISEQLDTLWHCSNLFNIPQQEELATKLTSISCADRVFFCNSGAEANEAAIKLARKYGNEKGKYEIITFEQSFHGRTLATLTATGQEKVKIGFSPLPEGFKTIPYNDIEALKEAIGDKTCAIMLEMVQGEGGVHPADPAWVEVITEQCQQHGLLLIVDEVQTGIGRTGKWFAHQHYGIEPDIITMAKGLGSGFPIGAMMAKEFLADTFGPGTHGTTFGGNPLAMAAGLATLEAIEAYLPEVEEKGAYFMEKLGGRGKGLMIGVEFDFEVGPIVTKLREEEGILALVAGPKVLRILPPFTITQQEMEMAVEKILQVVQAHKGAVELC
ncbi:acetylornithine transaminase [Ammoniphilus sp. CFH 90114]|uniref:acetylornithine transaminase n=1 Tax=Ammoniphilus sp. CFH 90114 TaxID=2493665 RepID=UPI00100F7878|nr:acetylornithine transaminase [Ammoniphilus sp. CFH 90114]RXT04002.1 acetylornithine transaminase [Ammoniphilus sp. CFH 90114]